MTMAQDKRIDKRNIDAENFCIFQKPIALASIEQNSVPAIFDIQRKPMLGAELRIVHNIFNQRYQPHIAPLKTFCPDCLQA
jgi:hypothetical protein